VKTSVVVVSSDSKVHETLERFFKHYDYKVRFDDLSSRTLLALYENSARMLILDIEENSAAILSIITIIRKMHSNLPIVALCSDTSVEAVRELSQRGVFYCAMKPVQTTEMEKVMEAYKRLQRKRKNQNKAFSWAARPVHGTA
jgi:DNA-binding NtrC family response regulator